MIDDVVVHVTNVVGIHVARCVAVAVDAEGRLAPAIGNVFGFIQDTLEMGHLGSRDSQLDS